MVLPSEGKQSRRSHVVDLRHGKEPYRAQVRCFVGKMSRSLLLTRDSPASLPDGSGCCIRMIRVCWGCSLATCSSYALTEAIEPLTAACAHQGSSATDDDYYYYYYYIKSKYYNHSTGLRFAICTLTASSFHPVHTPAGVIKLYSASNNFHSLPNQTRSSTQFEAGTIFQTHSEQWTKNNS
jgi:hypothetical protein